MKFASFVFLALLALSLPARSAPPPLQIVSTPNPNVFPLLVALHDHPDLPVHLIAVKNSAGIDAGFKQGGDGVLAMTYAIAQRASDGRVPDLALEGVYFWRGFFEMTMPKAHSYADLKGKGLIVSGPVTNGKGGAPDMLFHAALARAGTSPDDFSVCYLPVRQGVQLLESGKPMNSNPACKGTIPAAGLFVAEPGASGMILKSSLSFGTTVKRSIDVQKLFSGYTEWQPDELPHGGFGIRRAALNDPVKLAQYKAFIQAYRQAIDELNHADGFFSRLRLGHIISSGMDQYFGQFRSGPPTMVVAKAIGNGELEYRDDRALGGIQTDLGSFLKEVLKVKTLPPGLFLDTSGAPKTASPQTAAR